VFVHRLEQTLKAAGPHTKKLREKHLGIPAQRGRLCRARIARGSGLRLAISCVLLTASFPVVAQNSIAPEYRSKANFLAKFPSFIDWPADAFPSAQAPFIVCDVGDFPFGTSLAEDTRSIFPQGRRVEIRWKHKDEELRSCNILFVSRSETKRYTKILQSIQGLSVLTVGETPDFLDAGGAVSFSFEQDTLQFEVNLVAASGAHLKISSRLLMIARKVLNKPEAAKLYHAG
jgi:YfiR/HmsC-like